MTTAFYYLHFIFPSAKPCTSPNLESTLSFPWQTAKIDCNPPAYDENLGHQGSNAIEDQRRTGSLAMCSPSPKKPKIPSKNIQIPNRKNGRLCSKHLKLVLISASPNFVVMSLRAINSTLT